MNDLIIGILMWIAVLMCLGAAGLICVYIKIQKFCDWMREQKHAENLEDQIARDIERVKNRWQQEERQK